MAVELAGRNGTQRVPEQPMRLHKYDEEWPATFASRREALLAELGGDTVDPRTGTAHPQPIAIRIDHVGSTAVSELDSRPVVDIQVSVADPDAEEDYRPGLERLGYRMRQREADRRVFAPASGPYDTEVVICRSGGAWEFDRLVFAAYLTAHPERRDAYGDLKRRLLDEHGADPDAYAAAKAPFIRSTLRLAARWLGDYFTSA